MEKCGKCGAEAEEGFDVCWSCGATLDRPEPPREDAITDQPAPARRPAPASRRVRFRVFQSAIKPWEELFGEAADYATQLGRDSLISISHSEDGNDGVVTVWFWGE